MYCNFQKAARKRWVESTWFHLMQPRLQFRTVALDPAPDCRVVCLQAALAEELFDITASRNESEYRRYQRTAQRINSGSVCLHLKIAGRIVFFMISSGYQPPSAKVATQPNFLVLLINRLNG